MRQDSYLVELMVVLQDFGVAGFGSGKELYTNIRSIDLNTLLASSVYVLARFNIWASGSALIHVATEAMSPRALGNRRQDFDAYGATSAVRDFDQRAVEKAALPTFGKPSTGRYTSSAPSSYRLLITTYEEYMTPGSGLLH
ncbi:hypothetical protein L218DRAFT_947467 [Marasmius fiardii PR-910]|nr:hypothetical protein L218DRAFT_947467 [Marasmius fiardii PR-910]